MPDAHDLMSGRYAPRTYAAIGADDLELHVVCHCGTLLEAATGATIWQLLMLYARHLAERHPEEDLALAGQLAGMLPATAAIGGRDGHF